MVKFENLKLGKTYSINHRRKGIFIGKVKAVHGDTAEILITEGKAGAVCNYNEKEAGEIVKIRESLCTITKINDR